MVSEPGLSRQSPLGHDGNAHAALMPMLEEKEDLRGVMSSRLSFGVGGGGGGGREEGDDAVDVDDVVEPKLKLNRILAGVKEIWKWSKLL